MKPVKPDLSYAEQILAYKREMEEHHVSFDGCAGHENTETVQKWLDFETRLKAQYTVSGRICSFTGISVCG